GAVPFHHHVYPLESEMKRKIALFLFALSFGASAAYAGDPTHCNKLYNLCAEDPDWCYEQLLACLAR
ncbi:MAG TPA: hypothetical protein VF663_16985, partial [Telluria sp.]